jgi:phosphoribosylamine---glycine ligase
MASRPSGFAIFRRITATRLQSLALYQLTKLGKMKILVLGQGAREHAIVKSLIKTGTNPSHIIVAPGNKGIAAQVECQVDLDPNDPLAVSKFALENAIELAIIGPEAPLVAGVSDALRSQGIAVFGPSKLSCST